MKDVLIVFWGIIVIIVMVWVLIFFKCSGHSSTMHKAQVTVTYFTGEIETYNAEYAITERMHVTKGILNAGCTTHVSPSRCNVRAVQIKLIE